MLARWCISQGAEDPADVTKGLMKRYLVGGLRRPLGLWC
jgi:hypothetical protein